jgi:hypothetical protein
MPNYAKDFMSGYNFVDKTKRLNRAEERLNADRATAAARQKTADERSLVTQGQDDTRYDQSQTDRVTNLERQLILQGRQDTQYEQGQTDRSDEQELDRLSAESYILNAQEKRLDVYQAMQTGDEDGVKEIGRQSVKNPAVSGYMKQTDTEEGLVQAEKDVATMEAVFKGKGTKKDFIDAANRQYSSAVDRGDGGQDKKFHDFYPDESGEFVYVEMTMKDEDGKDKLAPMTPGRGAKDTQLQKVRVADFLKLLSMQKQEIATKRIELNARRIELGDNSPIAAQEAAAKHRLTRSEGAADTEAKNTFDMKKMQEEYRLKGENESLKTKTGSSGKSQSITLKTGAVVSLDDMRKSFLAAYGKPDGLGGFIVDAGAPRYDQWANAQAVSPVFSNTVNPADNQALYKKALEQATKEMKSRAGLLTRDSADFKNSGGDRNQFIKQRTDELMQMWGGQQNAGQAGTPGQPGAPSQPGEQPSILATKSPEQIVAALGQIPDPAQREEQLQIFFASDASDKSKEQVNYQLESQRAQADAKTNRGQREEQYAKNLQQRPTPEKVLNRMFTNVHKSVPSYGYDIADVAGASVQGLNQIADFFFIDPAKLVGSAIVAPLKAFQKWARAGGFNSRQEAVEAYTKENPGQAKQIQAAAKAAAEG